MLYKFIKSEDDLLGNTIYYVEGYQYGNNINARIFKEIKEEYKGSSNKRAFYFPVIDNEILEERLEVGEYRHLKDAKTAISKTLNIYITEGFHACIELEKDDLNEEW